jgi:DNA ligase D-like protein (predicted 3'-phosphoesterase)
MAGDALRSYRAKRDFRRTSEPKGRRSASRGQARFVVQEHAARSHHYDLRLEVDGVLKSWAVPKGPSTDPREKRLATATEDHPLEYLDFEGTIPKGEYGAGAMIVWDEGTYRNLTGDGDVPMEHGLTDGHVRVWLDGAKLHGGYALTRFRGDDQWLLVKTKDEGADARRDPLRTQPESVKTGRTVREVAEAQA